MSTIAIIAFILVISMMVGPVMLLQPSRSQKRLASLRGKANRAGFQVRMVSREGESSASYQKNWQDKKSGKHPWRLERKAYEHGLHFEGVWQWVGEGRPKDVVKGELKTILKQLPESVKAMEANASGVAFEWTEAGDEAKLDELMTMTSEFVSKVNAFNAVSAGNSVATGGSNE